MLRYFYLIDPKIILDINKNLNMVNFLIKFWKIVFSMKNLR
jgi:hypothetical protein